MSKTYRWQIALVMDVLILHHQEASYFDQEHNSAL
jgi:hypothetical protein